MAHNETLASICYFFFCYLFITGTVLSVAFVVEQDTKIYSLCLLKVIWPTVVITKQL